MKITKLLLGIMALLTTSSCCHPLLSSAEDCCFICYEEEEPASNYDPIFVTRDILEASVILTAPQPMKETGKIYVKDNLLFVNDKMSGFQIYNNSDPSNPVHIKSLQVWGSTDLAVKGNNIYINQATDLIALKYNESNQTIELTERIRNIYPPISRDPDGFPVYYPEDQNKIIVGFIKKVN